MNNATNARNPAMDIIRLFALFTVVSVHFFLKNGFYNTIVNCPRMYIMVALRNFFMVCVPLFLILSGYLLKNKKSDRKFYSKLFYTLGIYVLVTLVRGVALLVAKSENYTAVSILKDIIRFDDNGYSWYIEMYIGLFLLIPFLNVLYNNLETRRMKLLLIGTMLFITSLPIPDWWKNIYPISFYFIGCYLREYPIKLKTSTKVLLNIIMFIANGIFFCLLYHGQTHSYNNWSDHSSILIVIQTVLVFDLLANLKYDKIGEKASKVLAYLSKLTLGA